MTYAEAALENGLVVHSLTPDLVRKMYLFFLLPTRERCNFAKLFLRPLQLEGLKTLLSLQQQIVKGISGTLIGLSFEDDIT